jgi:hypothetical protein
LLLLLRLRLLKAVRWAWLAHQQVMTVAGRPAPSVQAAHTHGTPIDQMPSFDLSRGMNAGMNQKCGWCQVLIVSQPHSIERALLNSLFSLV